MNQEDQTIAEFCGQNLADLKANPNDAVVAEAVETACAKYILPLQEARDWTAVGAAVSILILLGIVVYFIRKSKG